MSNKLNKLKINNYKCLIYKNKNEILSIKSEWKKLFESSKNAQGFLSFPWMFTFLSNDKNKHCIIAVWDKDQLIALLPITIKKFIGITYAIALGIEEPSFYGLLSISNETAIFESIKTCLNNDLKVHFLYIDDYYSKDDITNDFFSYLVQNKYKIKRQEREICHWIDLSNGFENYYNNRKTKKQQKEIRKKNRYLERSGDISIKTYNGNNVTQDVLTRIIEIQKNSWLQNRGITPLDNEFYQILLSNLSLNGLAKAWILYINNESIAYKLGFVTHTSFYSIWTAFDKKYQSLRPGTYLTKKVIEDCCEEGITKFEFMHGEGEHKKYWSTDIDKVYRIIIYNGYKGYITSIPYQIKWVLIKNEFLRCIVHRMRAIFKK